MNQAVAEKFISEAEYLAFEEKSKIKHEFFDGEIFAMAGARRNHNKNCRQFNRLSLAKSERQRLRILSERYARFCPEDRALYLS